MTEPKFHIGQRVAVCCFPQYSLVIPETRITEIVWINGGVWITEKGAEVVPKGFRYRVADSGIAPVSGKPWLIREWHIRPLNDDDYKDEETEDSRPIEGVRA